MIHDRAVQKAVKWFVRSIESETLLTEMASLYEAHDVKRLKRRTSSAWKSTR